MRPIGGLGCLVPRLAGFVQVRVLEYLVLVSLTCIRRKPHHVPTKSARYNRRGFAGCRCSIPSLADVKLRISGQHAADHPATLALNAVEKAIEEAGVGLEAKVFPSNQLGDYTLVYEDIIRGNVDIAHLSVPSQLDPNLEANFFPFLVSNYDEMRRIYSPGSCFYKAYGDMQAKLGVRLMGIVPEGFIGVALTKPAENLMEAGADKAC